MTSIADRGQLFGALHFNCWTDFGREVFLDQCREFQLLEQRHQGSPIRRLYFEIIDQSMSIGKIGIDRHQLLAQENLLPDSRAATSDVSCSVTSSARSSSASIDPNF